MVIVNKCYSDELLSAALAGVSCTDAVLCAGDADCTYTLYFLHCSCVESECVLFASIVQLPIKCLCIIDVEACSSTVRAD